MTIQWPAVLKPTAFGFSPVEADQSGGASMTLGEQFVQSPGGRWAASGSFDIRDMDQVLALRALRAQLKGRAIPLYLPNFDGKRVSWPIDPETGVVLHPGNTREKRLDGTAYEYPAIPSSSEIVATVSSAAALRATTLAIAKTQGGDLIAGQQFGIDERLYEIATIESVVGNVTTVTFWPPLRAAAPAGTTVKFTRAGCLMRCTNMNDQMKQLDLLRFATLNLEFVEYI